MCFTKWPRYARAGQSAAFYGTATRPEFDYYKLEFKLTNGKGWSYMDRREEPVSDGLLMEWDTSEVPPGEYSVRLTVVDLTGNFWEEMAQVRVVVTK